MKHADSSVEILVEDRLAGLKPSDLNDAEKQSAVTLAMKVLAIKHRAGRPLSNPEATRNYLRLRLADCQNEVFGSLFLDNRHRIIAVRDLFQGTIDGASIHPRVVVQQALAVNVQLRRIPLPKVEQNTRFFSGQAKNSTRSQSLSV